MSKLTRFQTRCQLDYQVDFPSTLILNIHAQRGAAQWVVDEELNVEPPLPRGEFQVPGSDTRFLKLETGDAKRVSVRYEATVDCDFQVLSAGEIEPIPVAEMDASAIPFLFPSRYCQSDRLSRLAWDLFGGIADPYRKVVAIADWIHGNVEYVRGSTNSETSAYDTVTQRTGVCRDFAHLGIALCRALSIPARYFSGYAYRLEPPDFHACFEAYLGGRWLVFDATRLAPLNGLVRVGTGRDAAEAAVASIFGRARCEHMQVDCQLAPGQEYAPRDRAQLSREGVSLEAPAAV